MPNFLALLHTGRSLPLFTTGAKFGQVKPNVYSPRNLTLKQLSFSPSTVVHVGEFSGVLDGNCRSVDQYFMHKAKLRNTRD